MKNCLLFAVIVAVITGAGCSKSSNPNSPSPIENIVWTQVNASFEENLPDDCCGNVGGGKIQYVFHRVSPGTSKVGGRYEIEHTRSSTFGGVLLEPRKFETCPAPWDGNPDPNAMTGERSQNLMNLGIVGLTSPQTSILRDPIRTPERIGCVRYYILVSRSGQVQYSNSRVVGAITLELNWNFTN